MRKLFFLFLLLTSVAFTTQAQRNYKGGIGIALGSPSGINGKLFLSEKSALELIAGWSFNEYSSSTGATLLYQIHNVAFDVEELLWYYGIGGHAGVASWDEDGDPATDEGSTAWVGLDLVIGIEYTIPNAPINFSLEAVPGINLLPDTSPGIGANLGIRYVFK